MRALRYSVEEALAGLWRSGRSGALSILTIATALLVLGTFLLVAANLQRIVAGWARAAEFSVYLNSDARAEHRSAIERMLEQNPAVAAREYITQSEAAARFARDFPDLADVAATLDSNPLPASFEVRLSPGVGMGEQADALVTALRSTAGVADVRYDRDWIDRVFGTIAAVRAAGLGLAAILSLAAALTVASVVRLTLHARRDEIEIMKLVGAPIPYIQGPFVLEGILQGGIGALVALVGLWGVFLWGRGRLVAGSEPLLDSSALGFLPWSMCLVLLTGGLVLGCVGGWMAARGTR